MVSDVFDKEENRKNYIRDMLKTLTKREENVLRLYFGLDGRERFRVRKKRIKIGTSEDTKYLKFRTK